MHSHDFDEQLAATDWVLESVLSSDPDFSNVMSVDDFLLDADTELKGRRVTWYRDSSYVIAIPSDHVIFMEGNQWNFRHAAAIRNAMSKGAAFEVPAARIYKRGRSEYFAQLLDGNHRAAAAMSLGEPEIYVYVSENYRGVVPKKKYV